MGFAPTQEAVRFGQFELDLKALQLTRNGATIRLPQQPLRLLSILLESPGEIVTREHLRQSLWASDVFVDFDHGLNKSIQKLRDALGDSAASPRYIETIPRVGYRFIAPVHTPEAAPPTPRPAAERPLPSPIATSPPALAASPRAKWPLVALIAFSLATVLGISFYFALRTRPSAPTFTQLTSFTDSAMAPALSPDGHILAFIRGNTTFLSNGQIYVKILPDGEPKPITDDPRSKYGLAFSPDGSEISYTVMDPPYFTTYAVPVLGGAPRLVLKNAAGLTWLDAQHYLFSRIRSGLHLGVVTQSVSGSDFRELYYPAHERAMAHYSFPSPDHHKALVVEMNETGVWSTCRLISLEEPAPAQLVGPQGKCTSAGWSPDGAWMYFVVEVNGQSHIWRQRDPATKPEQITFGPSDESGLAVEQSGKSVITSTGQAQTSLWLHDDTGDRALSSEGEVVSLPSPPSFAPGDQTLYYLFRSTTGAPPELQRLTLSTGEAEPVFPGIAIDSYNLSPDGKQIVYSSSDPDHRSHLYLAPVDRSSPPRRVGPDGASTPLFGPHGKILFSITQGTTNSLMQINQDGSSLSTASPFSILQVQSISPARNWLVAMVAYPDHKRFVPAVTAIPLTGGPARRLCVTYCSPTWSPDGKSLYIPVQDATHDHPGRSLILPLGPGETLPALPPDGVPPFSQPDALPGARSINRSQIVPSSNPDRYAFIDTSVHRNLYRITLP